MKRITLMWGLLLVLLIPLAAGQGEGQAAVYTIPANISVNSSFLWVAEVPGMGEGTRVSWAVIGLVDSGALGSFERLSGSKWFCDFNRTCGPNPFPMAGGPYDANIYIASEGGILTRQQAITVSELMLDPHIYITGKDVLVQVNVPGYTGSATMRYSLYDARNLNPVQLGGESILNKNLAYCGCPAGFYNTSMSLEDGKYYLSFEVSTNDGKSGGSLHYFTIGEELQPLSVSLDKAEYWLGEKVRISGTTTLGSAKGEIKRGGGSKKNITFTLYSRGEYSEFSYDYLPKETGSYAVEVTAGEGNDSVSRAPGFTVSRLLDVPELDVHMNGSEAIININIKNLVSQTLNITVSPDDELEGYVAASLQKGSLDEGESTTLTLNIRNILSSVQGSLVFHTGVADVEETLRILVDEPFEKRPQIGVEPASWSPEEGYLLGNAAKTFTITNQGTGALGSFEYSLEDIDSDIVEVSLPETGIGMPPESGEMEVSIDPPASGRYRGVLSVTSSGGSQDITIDLEFFDDIGDDIDTLEQEMQLVISELTGRGMELPYAVSELTSDLSGARTSLEGGNYAKANRDFEKARATWDGVKSMVALLPEAGTDLDLSLVLITVVIVVAAAGGLLLLKRRGGGGAGKKEEEEPEELEEEMI